VTIAVTGATGFLGSALLRQFSSEGRPTIAIGGPHTKLSINNRNVRWIPYSSDLSELAKTIASAKPEAIVHCATHYVLSHRSNDIEPMFEANLRFGTQILQSIADTEAQFVNVSSYFQHQKSPEGHPTSLYAATKAAFADVVQWYKANSYIKVSDVTLFDTYGPLDKRQKLVPRLLDCASSGQLMELHSTTTRMNLCYVDDIVSAIVSVIENAIVGNWSVRAHSNVTVGEVARIVEAVTKRRVVSTWGDSASHRELPLTIPPDLPSWVPTVGLPEGITRSWANRQSDT